MSFFPDGFDFRSPVVSLFRLVNLDTPDGDFGFLLGSDGVFTDVNGKDWVGSTLFAGDAPGSGISGTAKAASLTMSFYNDPANPTDLISDIRDLGAEYIKGRQATFYLQCFDSPEQMHAPIYAPIQYATAFMDHLTFEAPNALTRSITLHLEGAFKVRGGASNLVYNTEGHSKQLGYHNPSYEFIPVEPRQEKGLIG